PPSATASAPVPPKPAADGQQVPSIPLDQLESLISNAVKKAVEDIATETASKVSEKLVKSEVKKALKNAFTEDE
ncbi:MAG: hypothetical protein V3T30_05645, partial [Thermodesulfobacteriota bacterium]